MTIPNYTITLRAAANAVKPATTMDNMTLYLAHLPRPGDFIRDGDYGTVEVKRVIFDTRGGAITLEIF